MVHNTRWAVYFIPASGDLVDFADSWLGWSAREGCSVQRPDVLNFGPPISEITQGPAKYGFHATLKPPFRLASGTSQEKLADDCQKLAAQSAAFELESLSLVRLGRFLALKADGDQSQINDLASRCVMQLDHHRAPMTKSEAEKRLASARSDSQRARIQGWGYPFVLDQYRFHMTMTDKLPKGDLDETQQALGKVLDPMLGKLVPLDAISLVGEGEDGKFRQIERFPPRG